jgi:HD-GYP domain-containing protein (c-di-GMP phosphodiesterase class II)
MLHDIGKVALESEAREHHEIDPDPDDPETLAAYYRHVGLGYELLVDKWAPATARHIVLHHHQRFDGRGWTDDSDGSAKRRRGEPQRDENIHVFSRIVAAANVLDNLLKGSNGEICPTVAALREFMTSRFDGWFDPIVRNLMVRRIPPFPIGSLVRLSDNRQAVVVAPNFEQPCCPDVRILGDGREADDNEAPITDLSSGRGLHIAECAGQRVEQFLFELPNYGRTAA